MSTAYKELKTDFFESLDSELSSNPDLLINRVKNLVQHKSHVDPREIAQELAIPEASLVAAAIGSGAYRLRPEVPRILVELPNLGNVLCAFGIECGSFMPLGHVHTVDSDSTTLRLIGDHITAHIDFGAIVDVYLVVEKDDMHGNSRSLQFFDGSGKAILKVYLTDKAKFKTTLPHFRSLFCADQRRTVEPSASAKPLFCPKLMSEVNDPNSEEMVELSSKDVMTSMLEEGGIFNIESIAKFTRAVWTGEVTKFRTDNQMLYLHENNLRAHLRFDAIKKWHYTKNGGISADGLDGRILRLQMPVNKHASNGRSTATTGKT